MDGPMVTVSRAPCTSGDANKCSLAQIWRLWKFGHGPYEDAGSDSLMLATPNGNMLWSCDNTIISQLLNQWPKCGIPVELVKFYDLWGPTIGSVEGNEWHIHRRAITSGFGTSINTTVWRESQHQTTTLVRRWIDKEGAVVPVVRKYTSRLALHIIA